MRNLMSIGHQLHQAIKLLSPVSDSAHLDAEILLAFTLNKPRSYLYACPEKNIDDQQHKQFSYYLQCRQNKQPIAYITGKKEFWSLEFQVTPATLIPRPETELLIECALKNFSATATIHVADLGTGCGAIAMALAYERPSWQIYATDISKKSLEIARKNAERLQLENISFYQGNWFTALPDIKFDIILSNPPYLTEMDWADLQESLRFEPYLALVGGQDGLDCLREISRKAHTHLQPGGYVLVEHGFLQGSAVRDFFRALNYAEICTFKDLAGKERVTMAVISK